MEIERKKPALRDLRTLFSAGTLRDLTDGQLLERFALDRGESAQQAFSMLVDRHGPMVLRVCRSVLTDAHGTQDAFQATFLVLVKKPRSLWVRDSLGPWLHQVALRTASCTRRLAARRRRHERIAAVHANGTHSKLDGELEHVLHEEIDRLPDRYRAPVVLCDLEGRTHEQAARHLGWPVGTVKSRQSRARERLRERLLRRGLEFSAGVVGRAVLVPPALLDSTTSAVVHLVKARAIVQGSAALLAHGVLRSMMIARSLHVASVLLLAAATTSGVGLLVQGGLPIAEVRSQANPQNSRADDRLVHRVKPGKIRFEVIERGSLEPSRIHKALSQVEGQVTIVSILPDGSQVKAGDLVCELDSASLKDSLVNQTIATKSAEAAYENVKLARELAEIALTEYFEGILKPDRATLKNEIGAAAKNMQKANDRLERIRSIQTRVKDIVARKGAAAGAPDLVAELDIEEHLEVAGQRLVLERSALEQAKSKLERLEKYTSKKMIHKLKIEIEQARADELAKSAALRVQKKKEAHWRTQVENCKISAPFDGYVVLANDAHRNANADGPQIAAGAIVDQRQKIFTAIDQNAPMRVNAKARELYVDRLAPGQRARIMVDAFPDQKLTGVVKSVAPLPDSTNPLRGGRKLYRTLVEIENGSPDLRPGMTAKVEILVAERDNVLNVPVNAVLTFGGKDHVAVKKPDGTLDWREVKLGLSDERIVEVKQGLTGGEVVILDPLTLMSEEEKREKIGSPPTPTKPAAKKNAPR
jgi:RND family efflux transporter MFP subunit